MPKGHKRNNTPEEKKALDKKRKAEWYQKNKERLDQKHFEWRQANPDKVREHNRKQKERRQKILLDISENK